MNFMSYKTYNEEETFFVAMNKGNNNAKFILPREVKNEGKNYYIVFDTKSNDFYPEGILYEPEGEEPTYIIEPHTIVFMLIKD